MKIVLKATPTRIFLYHGVKDPANVEKILRGGFDLTKLESNWISLRFRNAPRKAFIA